MTGHGNLVIKPKQAKIEKEKSLIEKIDSYLSIYIDLKNKLKSETIKKGGNRPKFKKYYSLRVSPEDKLLNIDLYDEDVVSKDDFIGNLNLQICEIKELRYINNIFVLRNKDGKKIGSLELEIEYYDDFDTSTEEENEEVLKNKNIKDKNGDLILDNILDYKFTKGNWKLNASEKKGIRMNPEVIKTEKKKIKKRVKFREEILKKNSFNPNDISFEFKSDKNKNYNPLDVNMTQKLSLIRKKDSFDSNVN